MDLERLLYPVMRHLPVEIVSAIGGAVVRTNVRFNRKTIAEGARRNLRRHRPELGDADIERIVWRFLDNVGRLMAEFAVLHRLAARGRIEYVGLENSAAEVGQVPTVALALHLGNWEVFGPAMQLRGIPIATFYEPPDNPLHRQIAEESRRRFGLELLSPDRRGIRQALKILQQNGIVAIFADEARQGKAMAPLFGRPPHDRGNLAIAAKLARHSGARLLAIHCERTRGARFRLHFEQPFRLPPETADILEDVATLNRAIEPIILNNLDKWYYLDDSIDPVA